MKKMLMAVLMATTGCAQSLVTPVPNCETACTEDADCVTGHTCGDVGLCAEAGAVCERASCTPGELLGCNGEVAERCADDGVSVTSDPCTFGCNAEAARCNECVPEDALCSGTEVQTCGADGLIASTESCELGCANATVESDTRCKHIEPAWIPQACDAPSVAGDLVPTEELVIDTGDAAACNGGVIAQASGPEICVMRYRSILSTGTVRVTGNRAIAFVTDDSLTFRGFLDVSAKGSANGPGGGRLSGGAGSSGGGGGGGFKQTGARGGTNGVVNAFGAGGGILDPLTTQIFEGGSRPGTQLCGFGESCPVPGGGGGALLLVSCTGTVEVAGVIAAGGGGGGGGRDKLKSSTSKSFTGASGGGSGGYVVLQGAKVVVSGAVFANGGGGGGGCGLDNCVGATGQDGAMNGTGGAGGAASVGIAAGGNGGIRATAPVDGQNGELGSAPGAGGGSTGRIQIYTPAGVSPTVTPTSIVEPQLEPGLTVQLR